MSKRRRKKKQYIPQSKKRSNDPTRLISTTTPVIRLKNFRLGGIAISNAKAGEELMVLVRALLTSDEREFHQYMESIGNMISAKAREAGVILSLDSLLGLLLVIHKDETAELYLNNVGMSVEILAKRSIKAGEVVYGKDIADIRRLKYQDITFVPTDKVFYCFKVGWKFGLFFDLADNRDLDMERMEYDSGRLYRRLRYQGLYEALADKAIVERITASGWFPFIETMGGDFDPLLKAYEAEFDVEAKENKLIESFGPDRIDAIADRWWKNPIIAKHQTVLQAGLNAFKNKDYVSCTKNIMTEIEGILSDLHLAEKGSIVKTEELLRHAVDKGVKKSGGEASLFFPDDFLKYLLNVAYANFDPYAPESAGASRHTIGHGRASGDTYTPARALQAILTLDQIAFYL